LVLALADALGRETRRSWRIMEVCGGQTHAFMRFGLGDILPTGLELIHGPGCPVCVTSVGAIDAVIGLAARPEVTVCTFGDMLRVPGTRGDLLTAKARGGDVRIYYSPMQALEWARTEPGREVVVFAVGFETTAPNYALLLDRAMREGVHNLSVLSALVLVPPVLRHLWKDGSRSRVEGLLAPGHVCAVTGFEEYEALAREIRIPVAVTGFEPVELMSGLLACVRLMERGESGVVNAYPRVVQREGNRRARALLEDVFRVERRYLRGIGWIESGGWGLSETHARFDAQERFGLDLCHAAADVQCISGRILQGLAKPLECPVFGTACTPERPLGPTMVSSEGACAAYYRYGVPGGRS
jgi:hydrogenase expression/formation protein HypD